MSTESVHQHAWQMIASTTAVLSLSTTHALVALHKGCGNLSDWQLFLT